MKRPYALALSALLLTGALMTGCGTIFTRDDSPNTACPFADDRQASVAIGGAKRIRIDHTIGDLEARDVKGDLTIRSHGTGDATYSNIGGKMDVPKTAR